MKNIKKVFIMILLSSTLFGCGCEPSKTKRNQMTYRLQCDLVNTTIVEIEHRHNYYKAIRD